MAKKPRQPRRVRANQLELTMTYVPYGQMVSGRPGYLLIARDAERNQFLTVKVPTRVAAARTAARMILSGWSR